MTTRKTVIGLLAFALLGTAWCVVAAEEEDNVVVVVEVKVEFTDCPVSVQKAIQEESVGATLNEIIKVTEDGKSSYRADVTFEARDYVIIVAEDGTLLGKMLDDDDETTVEMKFTDCPAVVQKALKREARGAKIETVFNVTNIEKTEYVAYATIVGKKYEITVTEDGVLLSKLLESGDEKKADEEVKET